MKSSIVLIVVIVFSIITGRQMAKKYYFICPNCNNRFKVSPIKMATSTTVINFDKHKLRCPVCKNKNYMKQIESEVNHD